MKNGGKQPEVTSLCRFRELDAPICEHMEAGSPDELIRWMDSALTGVFWRLLMSPWVRLGGDLVGLVVIFLVTHKNRGYKK